MCQIEVESSSPNLAHVSLVEDDQVHVQTSVNFSHGVVRSVAVVASCCVQMVSD